VGDGVDLRAVEAILELRKRIDGTIALQVAALCFPLTGPGGRSNVARLRAALDMGADVVGEAPHIDPDRRRHLEICPELPGEYGPAVDLHTDEHLDPERLDLLDIASMATGFSQRVTASHAVSLVIQPVDRQTKVRRRSLRPTSQESGYRSRISIYSAAISPQPCPAHSRRCVRCSTRGSRSPGGGDNVRDVVNPIGSGDPSRDCFPARSCCPCWLLHGLRDGQHAGPGTLGRTHERDPVSLPG
jgi:cytosine/creatinine deaminase